jgi:hypothetical protein
MTDELKPCPFCGSTNIGSGEIIGREPNGEGYSQTVCNDCCAAGSYGKLRAGEVDYGSEKADAAWNRRATPADPYAEYRRGVREAFNLVNMINANRQCRNDKDTCSYIVRSLAELANGSSATPADQELVVWQDGVGMLWDVYSHGKLSKKVVSPISWDAWSVYRHMVDVGKFSPNIDVRLADTRASPVDHSVVVRMLEGYAESYEMMARQEKDATVRCSSVAVDIRQNMAQWVRNHCTPTDHRGPVTTVPLILTEQMRIAVKDWVQRHPVPGAGLYAQELWNDILSATPADHSRLQVWNGPMPESNGKTNFTAILHRGDISKGFTIDRSEYPDRVRYEADRVRWLIGEIDKEPYILDYDANRHSGYVAPAEHGDPVSTPEGWKLVPTEPTETMVVDGFESWPAQFFSSPEEWETFEAMSGCQKAAHKARLCYRAMLAAAPQAPQKDAESVRDAIVEMAAEIATVKRFTKFNMKGERAGTKCTLNVSYDLLEQLDAALKSVQPELRS